MTTAVHGSKMREALDGLRDRHGAGCGKKTVQLAALSTSPELRDLESESRHLDHKHGRAICQARFA